MSLVRGIPACDRDLLLHVQSCLERLLIVHYWDLDSYAIYSIFPLSTLLLSVLGLSRQLGGAGDTKMVSKACLIESERNCFHTAKCLWGKMNIIFILSFISVSIILILSFYVFLFVFHPQSLKRSISGAECSALNCQIK